MTEHQIFHILVDMREQRSGLGKLLEGSQVLDVEYADLPVGDIVISDEAIIERKESTDFGLSIMDRRIFSQVAHLKASCSCPIVIIEGDPFSTISDIAPNAIRGALSWLAVIEGVRTVHTKNVQETAAMVEIMARHAQAGLGYEIPLRCAKPKDLGTLSRYLVEGLPSVGAAGAKKLIEHFGSAMRVFSSSVDELVKVEGIGANTAKKIREALEHEVPTIKGHIK